MGDSTTRRRVLEAFASLGLLGGHVGCSRAAAPIRDATVSHIGAVDPRIVGVTIDVGSTIPSSIEPYVAKKGDRIEIPKRGRLPNGEIKTMYLKRDGARIGWIVGKNNDHVTWFEQLAGPVGDESLAARPEQWSIRSDDDPGYRVAIHPVRIWRKRKPRDWVRRDAILLEAPSRYYFYIVLPRPLLVGASYSMAIDPATGLHARLPPYTHDPDVVRSEAVHVVHTGYRPDDPGKRAYLSVWLGDGGGHRFSPGLGFRIVEADTGKVSYSGVVRPAWPIEAAEGMGRRVNHNYTDVGYMDFADLGEPGAYRLVVEGIGCSYPFTIGDDGWRQAFRTSMRGFLHQRAGMELGPPRTEYRRPLNLHPSMVTIWQSKLREGEGDLQAIARMRSDRRVAAWGGYHDAGDFDRRSIHLVASRYHMTLLELFPSLGQSLWPAQGVEKRPALLEEALWNVMLYRRLQREEDGAVSHGIEARAHPRSGEPSWMTSLTLVAFAPDARSSYHYAAAAAQAARLLRRWDPDGAEDLAQSAIRAFNWAERHPHGVTRNAEQQVAARNLAACELYSNTGQTAFHDVFEATTLFVTKRATTREGHNEQEEAAFRYVRLPLEVVDSAIRENCLAAIIATAEDEARSSHANAFNVSHPVASMPLILGRFSAPQTIHSCWAHWLTRERRYLETAVRSCHFGLGANPMNMTLTSGLGHEFPRHPLHLDSRDSGQPAPAGLTVYGNNDFLRNDGAVDWLIWPFDAFFDHQCFPPGRAWPITESYFDVFGVPSMNEFTISQTMAPASFVWGYLAARA